MFATYSVFTALRGIANPSWAMALMIGSNALNAIIDPILIFGWLGMPALGVDGAAYASVFSYTLTFGVGLLLFRTNWTNVRLHLVGAVAMNRVRQLMAYRRKIREGIGLEEAVAEAEAAG